MPKIYLQNSNIPKQYQKDIKLSPYECDLQAYMRLNNIKENISTFVKQGENLFIYSKITGNGKTSWSCKLLNSYLTYADNFSFTSNCPVYFVNIVNLLSNKKESMNGQFDDIYVIEKYIRTAKLVAWDDIAIRGLSEFDKEYLYDLINDRLNNNLSNIYTSNITPSELELLLGARLYSRVINKSILIEFFGGDRRKVVDF